MTIRHLTVFAAVAEQGSMSAAAKHLYLSQPTVSQAIRELEAHYNGLLFERLGKKLYLTERGKLLLPHAREMIRQFQQLEELMQNQGQSSTLKLGSTLTVGTCLTPSIILDLQKKIPDLDVYSFVTNTQNIEQKLLRSELDAAVVEGEIHSPDLVVLPIIDDCLVLATGKKHPFYRRGRIHVQELNNQKFAVREYGSGTRQLFEDYTLRHDLKIRTAWEANSPQALLNAVLYNQMLSVMSIRLMHHEIRHRSVRVFCNEDGMEWTFSHTPSAVSAKLLINVQFPVNDFRHFVWTCSFNGTFFAALACLAVKVRDPLSDDPHIVQICFTQLFGHPPTAILNLCGSAT